MREHQDVPQHVALPLLRGQRGGRHRGGGRQQALLVDEGDEHHALPVRACGRGRGAAAAQQGEGVRRAWRSTAGVAG